MWLCVAVLVGCFFASQVQAICQVRFDESTTGIGVHNTTFRKTAYCAYLGVRYGEPPVGKLRFRRSVMHQPSGHQNYTTVGSMCTQFRDTSNLSVVLGVEDCLFANIYTPNVDVAAKKHSSKGHPVLVFVHGGSYQIGDGERDINGVDLLVDHGILVITFNYRLNMLGFLKSDAYNISGNYGLKDQTTLLQWVQRYIKHFGGDPEQVTLMGQSAGGGSVTHHLYIPQSKDLFQRLIALSGSLLAPWSFMFAYQLCSEQYMGDLNPHSKEHLQEMDVHDFFRTTNETYRYWFPFASMGTPYFIPVKEQHEIHHDSFTVPNPQEAVLHAPVTRVPMLLSETGREFEDLVNMVNLFFFYPNIPLNWTGDTSHAFVSAVNGYASASVAEGHATSVEQVIQQIASYGNMKYPMRRLAKDLTRTMDSSTHPIYYLRFEFDGRFGKSKNDFYRKILTNPEYGAMHGDELGYIFTPDVIDKALAAPDEYREEWRIHNSTVELIANFIKHGNPTPTYSELVNITWTPLNENNSSNTYLNIDRTFEVRQFEDDRYCQYWDKLYNCLYYNVCDGIFEADLHQ
ncbi:juvenile hormone esterase-like [Anopheles maculipalpis]|uniref:juvenile hormone esterase-like n=1 Tax=Anopheles maculipalpis TaxID=1496333 RepID=UPI0021597AEA|nr:juvenile hormone esterase-like [Anopheles maculipalpis]